MRYSILLLLVPTVAYADSASNGPRGINAGWTLPGGVKLQGQGVGLGQVEGFRPGKPDFDTHPDDHNDAVKPFAVYNDGQPASPGDAIDNHAISVAGIMIADGSVDDVPTLSYAGVSPMASLYASAFQPLSFDPYADIMAATHNILDPDNTPRVRDVNYSFAHNLTGFEVPDGNAPLSQYVDWEAYRNDNLIVVGGPVIYQSEHPTPADNFNGITVGSSTRTNVFGHWDKVHPDMLYTEGNDAEGDRVSVDILAPGDGLAVLERGNDPRFNADGVSLATPHVTGALAHLRQYGNHFIDTVGGGHWDGDAPHRHEVMKAVLLNSADKLAGIHGSSRNIYRKDGLRWHETQAALDISVPLDQEMGAGHLNVRNAIKQYRTGQWGNVSVPNIGWDYGTVGASLSYNFYELNRPLAAGEVVAATLCWDRRVQTISPDQDDYTQGFFDYTDLTEVLVDLDLYLMPVGGDPNNPNDIIWASVSAVDNVEHIFIPVPDAGSYQLVVFNSGFGLDDGQEYGLAWWAGESLSGDFDGDGDVDGDDLDEWKLGFGPSGNGDADNDGDSDGSDFLVWQRNLGNTAATSAASAVPEPASWLLLCLGLMLCGRGRRPFSNNNRTRINSMTSISLLAVTIYLVRMTGSASAAEMTLNRHSRPVTAAEAADGAPANGMVHDFYATSSSDVLCIATTFNHPVYRHPWWNDYSAPPPDFVAEYPAVGASSFLATPGSTFTLGGGINSGGIERAWADLDNNGPQTSYLFGRLTTTEPGSFAGDFYLKGVESYIKLPFSFALPSPSGPLTEWLSLSGVEETYTSAPAPESQTGGMTDIATPEIIVVAPFEPWEISRPPLSSYDDIRALKVAQLNRSYPHPISASASQIPEPAAWALFAVGLPLLVRRRLFNSSSWR